MCENDVQIPGADFDLTGYDWMDDTELFDTVQPFSYTLLSGYLWFDDVEREYFYIVDGNEVVMLRSELIYFNPIFAKAINTLKAWFPGNELETRPRNAVEKIKINTTFKYLQSKKLIEDNPITRIKTLVGEDNYMYISNLIRGEVLRDKKNHLGSFVMNQKKRSTAYWENKYSALIGLQAGGLWDIVDFYYEEAGTFCELGHAIKRTVVVREQTTGVQMQYGETCVQDFLLIEQTQIETIKQYFSKYKDLLIEYWLSIEVYYGNGIFTNLQQVQIDLLNYFMDNNLIEFSLKRSIKQGIRTGKRNDMLDGLSNFDVITIIELNNRGLLVPSFLFRYLIDNNNLYKAIDKWFIIKDFKTKMDKYTRCLLLTAVYGAYGIDAKDSKTDKFYYTNHLGIPITNREMEDYVGKLNYTDKELEEDRYIGYDYAEMLTNPFDIVSYLNVLSTLDANNVIDNTLNREVNIDITDMGYLQVNYKDNELIIKDPYSNILNNQFYKDRTYLQVVTEGTYLVSTNYYVRLDDLNYKNGKYIGYYDILTKLGNKEDIKYYNPFIDEYFKIMKHNNKDRFNLVIKKYLGDFLEYWGTQMLSFEQYTENKPEQDYSNEIHKIMLSDKIINQLPEDYRDKYIKNYKHIMNKYLDVIETQKRIKAAELELIQEEKDKSNLDRYDTLDKAYPLLKDIIEGKEDFKNDISIMEQLDRYADNFTLETYPDILKLTLILNTNRINIDKHKVGVLKIGHYLYNGGNTDFFTQDEKRKLSFILGKVAPTVIKTGKLSDKQWQYGGDTLVNILRTKLQEVFNKKYKEDVKKK